MKKLFLILSLVLAIGCLNGYSVTRPQKARATTSQTATSLPAGFDINTIIVREGTGEFSYLTFNPNIVKGLTAAGFKLVRTTREKVYMGSEDDTPTSIKANVYGMNGINVTVARTTEMIHRVTLSFPNAETFRQFFKTVKEFGYTERYTIEGTTIFGVESQILDCSVKGLKVVFDFNS